jgi:hypothetical protein
MRKRLLLEAALVVGALALIGAGAALAFDSGGKPSGTGDNTITWTGNGATGGVLNSEMCGAADDPYGENQPYLLWLFTTDGGTATITGSQGLHLGGTGSGDFAPDTTSGANFKFVTPYYTPDSGLTAYVDFTVTATGNGAWNLTISHGCAGAGEHLKVTKTADTSYDRTHKWAIDKKVETDNGYTENSYPKVWLYTDGSGNETATWTVDVTYKGYDDSNFNVFGDITIENDGTQDATINSVDDLLAGNAISVDCGVTFPYDLLQGDTLTCTYSEDESSAVTGKNVATVTTTEDTYSGEAPIVWGDPTNEYYKTVDVSDLSDLFGTQDLGSVTAPNDDTFTYSHDFAWADYGQDGCGDYEYDNTASINDESDSSASATLLVNVQCFIFNTAYANGDNSYGTPASEADCFIPDFSQWGWTNKINAGTYTWPLWAGAAGCDTSKGTLVGTVTVTYSGSTGPVGVTYDIFQGFLLGDTHVYSGCTKYPKIGPKFTVAPGQYTNTGCATNAWVIVHALVGIPDPNFGP